jgi:hypothetical protein
MSTSNSSCETNTDKNNKTSDSECKKSSKKSDSECCPLTSEQIFTKYSDAVVQVNGEFWFAANNINPNAKPTDPLPDQAETYVVCTNVSGFFINKHYIVCPASGIMAPLSITSAVYVLPGQADLNYENDGKIGCGIGDFGCDGKIKEYKNPVTATNISVTINNVNGKCYSFRYRAELVGLDGAGDVAVLYIDSKHPCNKNNPCIEECHPYFKFGSSKNAKIGSTVHLIGDTSASNPTIPFHSYETSFVTGTLNNNRYCDPSGWVLSECVSVSAPVYGFSSGLPIIDKCGRVIGMQTCAIKPQFQEVVYQSNCNTASVAVEEPNISNLSQVLLNMGKVIGPSEFMIRKVVKELIDAFCNRKHGHKHIHRNGCGPLIYEKKYLGIAYSKFTAANYDKQCPVNENCIACYNQFPGIMKPVSSDANCCVCPGQSSNCTTSCYQLAGIVVDAIAGVSPNGHVKIGLLGEPSSAPVQKWFVPGVLCDDKEDPADGVKFLPRPKIETLVPLSPGDVITHIGSHSVCNGQSTFAPAVLLWRGDHDDDDECVSITFRPCACHYEGICTVKVPLIDIPLYADYPWYAIDKFPNIAQMCTQLEFPSCQSIYPLYPSLACDCNVDQVLPFKPSF